MLSLLSHFHDKEPNAVHIHNSISSFLICRPCALTCTHETSQSSSIEAYRAYICKIKARNKTGYETLQTKPSAPLGTFSNLTNVNPADSSTTTTNYTLSENGIAWPGESKKYVTKPSGDISNLAPPPNWALRFPDGHNDSNIPDLKFDEHFQNWMRMAGLPTFTKLWARNDADTLQSGTCQIVVYMST